VRWNLLHRCLVAVRMLRIRVSGSVGFNFFNVYSGVQGREGLYPMTRTVSPVKAHRGIVGRSLAPLIDPHCRRWGRAQRSLPRNLRYIHLHTGTTPGSGCHSNGLKQCKSLLRGCSRGLCNIPGRGCKSEGPPQSRSARTVPLE
jgi:hypothetical protein